MTRCLVPPQKDFTVREALQQQDVERWLGFITFLCEVFGTMRSSTGEPFRVLVCPIYTCLREVRPRSSPGWHWDSSQPSRNAARAMPLIKRWLLRARRNAAP